MISTETIFHLIQTTNFSSPGNALSRPLDSKRKDMSEMGQSVSKKYRNQ